MIIFGCASLNPAGLEGVSTSTPLVKGSAAAGGLNPPPAESLLLLQGGG